MADRAPGFYWIDNGDGEPEPARWDGEQWTLLGLEVAPADGPIVLSETPIEPGVLHQSQRGSK